MISYIGCALCRPPRLAVESQVMGAFQNLDIKPESDG
jgi:hypothetical protein